MSNARNATLLAQTQALDLTASGDAILGLSAHVSRTDVAEVLASLLLSEATEVRWAAKLVLYGCTHFMM